MTTIEINNYTFKFDFSNLSKKGIPDDKIKNFLKESINEVVDIFFPKGTFSHDIIDTYPDFYSVREKINSISDFVNEIIKHTDDFLQQMSDKEITKEGLLNITDDIRQDDHLKNIISQYDDEHISEGYDLL